MKTSHHDIPEDVLAYVSGEMPEEEIAQFEMRLNENDELRLQVDQAKQFVSDLEDVFLKARFKSFHQAYRKQSLPFRYSFKYLGVAAAITFLLGIGAYLIFVTKNTSEDYYSYFNPYPDLITTRTNNQPKSILKALEHYRNGAYDKAILQWESYADSNKLNEEQMYYYAISLLGNHQPSEALDLFERIENSKFEKQVVWYISLCHLVDKNWPSARDYLMKINKGDFEYEKAQKILSQINDQ